ncbi:hypothetical protein ACVIGB_000854 [Bradyrhizobium sp. USDA 4341]
MHKVCNIRDPNLWANTPPEEIWARYCRMMDRLVTLEFQQGRPRGVTPSEPVYKDEPANK